MVVVVLNELWGSTGMSQKSIKNLHTASITFAPKMIVVYLF